VARETDVEHVLTVRGRKASDRRWEDHTKNLPVKKSEEDERIPCGAVAKAERHRGERFSGLIESEEASSHGFSHVDIGSCVVGPSRTSRIDRSVSDEVSGGYRCAERAGGVFC
jgi:hypothetical protein